MKFDPKRIDHISDVLPVIKDNPAFIVADKGWYTVIDYRYMADDMFKHPIEIECRGLKFDSKTGDIIARPYHKFHNLNERVGYKSEDVNLRQPHVMLDKLDGSMVHTCPSKLAVYLMTRMGHTEVAQQAEKFLEKNQIRYGNLFGALGIDEYTYIFEYIGPNNKIVLDYKEENLILTAIRHVRNGTYVFHDELEKLGKLLGIPVVGKYPIDPTVKVSEEELYESIKLATGNEGAVLRFDTGAMVKIKADEYVRKHRTKDLVSSQRGVLNLIMHNNVDDVIPQLDVEVADKLKIYEYAVLGRLSSFTDSINDHVRECEKDTQKEFALKVQKSVRISLSTIRKRKN
jgi:RNA ligase